MAADTMEHLADRYADRAVRSVFIYTREAHPGEHYRHHASMDDKRNNARAFRDYCTVRRQVLIDGLDGPAHRAYGLLPNMTWIIGRGGFIHYKAAWTYAPDIADALEGVLEFQEERAQRQWIPFYTERSAWSTRDRARFREGLVRSGPQALTDYERMLKVNADAQHTGTSDIGRRVAGIYKPGEEP
jgi:hypothetical protein